METSAVVSGYACELYDKVLFKDWHRVERQHHADGAKDRIEVLWINDAAAQKTQTSLTF